MFYEPPQFTDPDPLRLPITPRLSTWPYQISWEISEMLQGRDAAWLNAIARQIVLVKRGELTRSQSVLDIHGGVNPTRGHDDPLFFLLDTPGQIGSFAAYESNADWTQVKTPAERWERYAVFAFLKLREGLASLERFDTGGRDDGPYSTGEGWGLIIEAMRSLQIAQMMRYEARLASDLAKELADLRHGKNRSNRKLAVEWANRGNVATGMPFRTQEEAADYISERMLKTPGGDVTYKQETVKKWLIAEKWTAKAAGP